MRAKCYKIKIILIIKTLLTMNNFINDTSVWGSNKDNDSVCMWTTRQAGLSSSSHLFNISTSMWPTTLLSRWPHIFRSQWKQPQSNLKRLWKCRRSNLRSISTSMCHSWIALWPPTWWCLAAPQWIIKVSTLLNNSFRPIPTKEDTYLNWRVKNNSLRRDSTKVSSPR